MSEAREGREGAGKVVTSGHDPMGASKTLSRPEARRLVLPSAHQSFTGHGEDCTSWHFQAKQLPSGRDTPGIRLWE